MNSKRRRIVVIQFGRSLRSANRQSLTQEVKGELKTFYNAEFKNAHLSTKEEIVNWSFFLI